MRSWLSRRKQRKRDRKKSRWRGKRSQQSCRSTLSVMPIRRASLRLRALPKKWRPISTPRPPRRPAWPPR
nr:MAG TPA: hypothetical protein [Caudoviricetes sp.]